MKWGVYIYNNAFPFIILTNGINTAKWGGGGARKGFFDV